MAHDLATTNGRAAMMYTGEVPWHRLGTRLDEPATAHEAIEAAGLGYEVELTRLVTVNDIPIQDKLAVVREDSQKATGIPDGQHYVPKNCRSTCASALIASNVPTVVVKDFLGHATVATTENYYINTKPAMRAAASARKVRLENTEADETSSSDSGKM